MWGLETQGKRADDHLVIVGAGISVDPPSGAADFWTLRNYFLRLADGALDPQEFTLEEVSSEQVFDAIDDGREQTREAVRHALWWQCEVGAPNANHYCVAALLAAGVRVWTPNFDTLIERASTRMGLEVARLLPGDKLRP